MLLLSMMTAGLLWPVKVAAQDATATDSVRTETRAEAKDSTKTLMGRLKQVQAYLDAKARKKVDPAYIEVPAKPWRVMLRSRASLVDVTYENSMTEPGTGDHMDWDLHFAPPTATSIGFWVGYRGTGISYSFPITKKSGRQFSISSTGAKYGFNFRLRRFNTDETDYSTEIIQGDEVTFEDHSSGKIAEPVWIRSVYVNGYYVFNGRRYSQAAAYNQSVIQRRSAGSFLVGATWYQSSFDFSDKANKLFIFFGNNVNRIKLHQANIGVGYGYNWVPLRGLVVNVMAMPTVSVYDRMKAYMYETNYDLAPVEATDNYGDWDKETKRWANGKTHKPILMANLSDPQFDYWDIEPDVNYSMFHINLDLRLGIAYNWSNYFIGFQAQYNNFNYKNDHGKVNIYDAYARLSLGVRL